MAALKSISRHFSDKEIEVSDCRQIFVLGAPRSGTTFLSSLLKNTSFNAPVETHFITKYHKKLASYGDLKNRNNFRVLVKDILSERPVQQWHLDLDIDQFYDELPDDFSYADIVDGVVLKRKVLQSGHQWGDKTPHYLGDLTILTSTFPEAKYIYIVRDGRDVALSLLEKPWGPNNIYKCAEYWSSLNNQEQLIKELEDRNQLHFVKYEDLLENTRDRILEIYDFLGESISEGELSSLVESVQANNYDKWKTELTPMQLRIFEAIAKDELTAFGYEVINQSSKVTWPESVFFYMHEKMHRAWFLFKANIIDGFKIKYLGKEPFNE